MDFSDNRLHIQRIQFLQNSPVLSDRVSNEKQTIFNLTLEFEWY